MCLFDWHVPFEIVLSGHAAAVADDDMPCSLCHQIMDGEGDNDTDLIPAAHPRFCEAIKSDAQAYTSLFTRTFQNKTFHVYRVKKKRMKSTKGLSEGGATRQ